MLYLVNQLLKIYFRINKLHLCKALIRAIEASQYKDQFSLSQQVTYRYYVGRKAIFESDFKSGRFGFLLQITLPNCNLFLAEKYLTYAFERCHKNCRANKRLILIYLIPVKMLLVKFWFLIIYACFPVIFRNKRINYYFFLFKQGHLPTPSLLRKYDLLQFSEVVLAVREGNLLRLNKALLQHDAFFIRCGVYLILEKLKVTTYRNLFKKV